MDPIFANRVGIILNFVGSLLIAPELLGLKRLSNIEARIKFIFASIQSKVRTWLASVWKWNDRYFAFSCLVILFFLVLLILSFQAALFPTETNFTSLTIENNLFLRIIGYWAAGWVILALIGVVILVIFLHRPERSIIENAIVAAFLMGALPLIIFVVVLIVSPLLIITIPLLVLLALVNLLIRFLKGPKALSRTAVRLGILFLIIGTILQLVATF